MRPDRHGPQAGCAPTRTFPAIVPSTKVIAAHPILTDLALAAKRVPNPWRRSIPERGPIASRRGKNLSFRRAPFTVKAGEAIQLDLHNPDVVPHNWVLIKPGPLERIGDLTNKMIADPEALARHYVPADPAVLAYTDIVAPQEQFTIYFRAPTEKGAIPTCVRFRVTGW